MHPDAHGQANKLFTCHNLNGDLSKKNTMHYLIDRFSYYSTCKYIKACEQNKTNYLSFLQTHYYSDPADFTCCLLEQSEHHSQSLIFMMLLDHKIWQVFIVTSICFIALKRETNFCFTDLINFVFWRFPTYYLSSLIFNCLYLLI